MFLFHKLKMQLFIASLAIHISLNLNIDSYFKTSSSLAVRWGRFSPVLLPGVDSPLELRERPWTLWITEDDPGVAELLCLMFKIPFIASALRFKNNNTNCYFLQEYKLKRLGWKMNSK